jgi:hypothetical protein
MIVALVVSAVRVFVRFGVGSENICVAIVCVGGGDIWYEFGSEVMTFGRPLVLVVLVLVGLVSLGLLLRTGGNFWLEGRVFEWRFGMGSEIIELLVFLIRRAHICAMLVTCIMLMTLVMLA